MKNLICADSLPWLAEHRDVGAIITSLPDADEMEMEILEWRAWFLRAVQQCMLSASPKSAAIFYQTDRKVGGRLESKTFPLFMAAVETGLHCLWHKIVLRHPVGKRDLYRPGYTHMIAFTQKMKPGMATPDVINAGARLYPNAMGDVPALCAIEFVKNSTDTIVDPFCGRGTVCSIANAMGINTIGLDIDPKQIEYARGDDLLLA